MYAICGSLAVDEKTLHDLGIERVLETAAGQDLAFALAHAVLGFIISMMAEIAGPGAPAVLIAGNAVVVVLEGMIVAIQVVRLQYYEFFSKFFNETGREFKPFTFRN